MKKKNKAKTTDALEILKQIEGDDPELQELIAPERINAEVASEIYRLRTKAHLSQQDLAARVGTTQAVISCLEEADYQGHSLTMLQRIAGALASRVEVRFIPAKNPKRPKLKAA